MEVGTTLGFLGVPCQMRVVFIAEYNQILKNGRVFVKSVKVKGSDSILL